MSADPGLLRLEMRDGEIGYPVFQFDGRRLLPGIRDVVRTLIPDVATSWTIASWMTSPAPGLDGRTPLDALRAGDTDAVLVLARQTAAALEH